MALIFVGSYTEKRTDGVYVFRFDEKSGVLTQLGAFDAGPNPSYLALHPTLPMLYAVQEVGTGDGTTSTTGGFVTALPIESGGLLKKGLHTRVSSHGAFPCWISVHPDKRHLLVANYTSGNGSVCVVPLSTAGDVGEASDYARLGPDGTNSCAHCLVAAPNGGGRVLAADIKQNKLFIYEFDSVRGRIAPHTNPPYYSLPGPTPGLAEGAGPRHIVFAPSGRFLYCVTEYAATVSVFPWNPSGKPEGAIQTLPLLPADFKGKNSSAALHLSPDGKFLYASNRGHDSVAIFAVDSKTGKLDAKGQTPTHGGHPRDFQFSPSGRFAIVANRDTNNLVVFRVDNRTGALTPTGQEVRVPMPVCVLPTTRTF